MPEWTEDTARGVIALSIFGTGVVFLPAAADPVNVVKLTILVLGAVGVLVLAAVATIANRVLQLPSRAALVAGGALGVGLLLSAITAPVTTTAIVGTYGRNSGLLAYGAAIVLFFAGSRLWTERSTPLLAAAFVAAGLFTATYGLLQYLGIDAIAWNNDFNPIIASLGNPDFAAAYLGICLPAALWGALQRRWHGGWRLASGVTAGLSVLAASLSGAVQGPVAAAAGTAVLVAAWLLNRGGKVARRGFGAMSICLGAVVVSLAAGAAGVGPVANLLARGSFQARKWYWEGALNMFHRHPVFGIGLDHFGDYWRGARPVAAVRKFGGTDFTDAAHSVPLQMLSQGGLVLVFAYAVFTLTVAVVLFRGLRQSHGERRLLLGAMGGVWLAYVVQSSVSIDQVPLLAVQYVAAGCIFGLAGPPPREIRLSGALPLATETAAGRRARRVPAPKPRRLDALDRTLFCAVALAAVLAAWFALIPLRANVAARAGAVGAARGDGAAALSGYQHAAALMPGVGRYSETLGALNEQLGRQAAALDTYRRGLGYDPLDVALLRNAARLANASGRVTEAGRYLHRAVALDPVNPATLNEAAAYDVGHGEPKRALAYLEPAVRQLPTSAGLWATLGQARKAAADEQGARIAFRKALQIDPQNATATQGLKKLGGS